MDGLILISKTGPFTAMGHCPCGCSFEMDAITEQQLMYDPDVKRLRGVCPACGRMEWMGSNDPWGGKSPAAHRINEYL